MFFVKEEAGYGVRPKSRGQGMLLKVHSSIPPPPQRLGLGIGVYGLGLGVYGLGI